MSECNPKTDIVISDLLCFVVNIWDTLATDIVKICETSTMTKTSNWRNRVFFTVAIQEEGKDLKYVTRKGANKKQKNVEDIVTKLREIEVRGLPIFVARDLSLVPQSDISTILRNISEIQTNVSGINSAIISNKKSDDQLNSTQVP